jgi:hypothetical protein
MRSRTRSTNGLALIGIATWLVACAVNISDAQTPSKKITGRAQAIAVLSETKMLPGDDASHEVRFMRRLDRDQSDQFGSGQASIINTADATAGSGTDRGYRTVTLSNGDQAFAAYEGTSKSVAKSTGPEGTFQGKWWYTGGTGKFKGITGGGTYTGEFTPTSLSYQYQGEYQLK